MLCFFRSFIDFDLIEGHLISGQVGFGSNRVSLTFKKNQIGSDLDPDGSDGFFRSSRILPPLEPSTSIEICQFYVRFNIKW
jgi:hypothetical protein